MPDDARRDAAFYDHENEPRRHVADWGADDLFTRVPRRRTVHTPPPRARRPAPLDPLHRPSPDSTGRFERLDGEAPSAGDVLPSGRRFAPPDGGGSAPGAASPGRRFASPDGEGPESGITPPARRFVRTDPDAAGSAGAGERADRRTGAAERIARGADARPATDGPTRRRTTGPADERATRDAAGTPDRLEHDGGGTGDVRAMSSGAGAADAEAGHNGSGLARTGDGAPLSDGFETGRLGDATDARWSQGPGGRRTVVISGRPDGIARPRPERYRPPKTVAERLGPRPERIVAWAFALGLLLILIAIATADTSPV